MAGFEKKRNAIQFPDDCWAPPALLNSIPHGDMPCDKVEIKETHIQKAAVIFSHLKELLPPVLNASPHQKAVVSVCGGSGVGKSEIASLLAYYLNSAGIGSYTLSGDNYPRRIPKQNDAERLRIFRTSAVLGLVNSGIYTGGIIDEIKKLQQSEADCDPSMAEKHPWLEVYQREGKKGLKGYLGTSLEIDFAQLEGIVSRFKNGARQIWLKRMGREETELWYDAVDFSNINILIIEWTHGNSDYYQGVDVPVLLNSTPEETKAHRKQRGRDGKTDSAFTTAVLGLEQELLESQAHRAKLIVSKDGDILDYKAYRQLMAGR